MRAVGSHTVIFDAPALSEAELARRTDVTPDACELDDERFFIRGRLEIPISDEPQPLEWRVWVSVGAAAYVRLLEPSDDDRAAHFGWLANELAPAYPTTLNLRTSVHGQGRGMPPIVIVESISHPLALEQREGVTFQRLHEIQHALDFEHVRGCLDLHDHAHDHDHDHSPPKS